MSSNSEDNNLSNQMMEEDDDSKIFPQRLMEILSDERYNDSISWLPHGRAFVIKNRKLFGETVMPKYFSRKAKYSSFTRKLNRWNFVRVSGGPELGAYYHEFFLRDKPQLAAQMFCKNARSKLAMAAMSESEPKATPVVTPAPVVATQTQVSPTSALMEAMRQKVPEHFNNNNNSNQIKAFPSYGNSTMQLLQRQLDMLQQEQSNKHFELLQQERTRMLLEQASSSFQNNNLMPPAQVQQKQQLPQGQAARLLQMQQLMQMQMQQRQGRVSNNPRASAA